MRSDRNPYLLHLYSATDEQVEAKEVIPYGIAVLKNFGNSFWFVFDRSGTIKIAVKESLQEAKAFVDQWNATNYEC